VQQGGFEYVASEECLRLFWPAEQYALIQLVTTFQIDAFYDEASRLLPWWVVRRSRGAAVRGVPPSHRADQPCLALLGRLVRTPDQLSEPQRVVPLSDELGTVGGGEPPRSAGVNCPDRASLPATATLLSLRTSRVGTRPRRPATLSTNLWSVGGRGSVSVRIAPECGTADTPNCRTSRKRGNRGWPGHQSD
jgi:hypothetical protein